MNTRKRIIRIAGVIALVLVAALATVVALEVTHPDKSTQSSVDSKNELIKKADAAFKKGSESEKIGDTVTALKSYEEAYTYYKEAGNDAQVASLTLKIKYMKKILETEGKTIESTVDTSEDSKPVTEEATTPSGNKSTPLPDGNSTIPTAPTVPGTPSPDTTGTPSDTNSDTNQ